MNDLLHTELFSLLTEHSQEVSKDEMHKAYENFVYQVEYLNESENDYSVTFRMLNFTRIEFMTLQALFPCEQGKKCA